MESIVFVLKKQDKGKFLDLIKLEFKKILNIDLDLDFDSIEDNKNYKKEKSDNLQIFEFEDKGVIRLSYDEEISFSDKVLQLIKDLVKNTGVITLRAVLSKKENGYLHYSEIFYCNPEQPDEVCKDLKFDALNPDYKEKIGDKYLLMFSSKAREKSSSFHHSFVGNIKIKYSGTDKEEERGLWVYSEAGDKYKCDHLAIGKIFVGNIASGVAINYEEDILKALQEANRLLKKRGMEIVDLKGAYNKIMLEIKDE